MKPVLKKILRKLGLIKFADSTRYLFMKLKNYPDNLRFKKEFPDVPIPPDYVLYEAHQIKYRSYYDYGLTNARRLVGMFESYIDLRGKRILDWGCGPARIVRHLPELLRDSEIHGCDYNLKSIEWNSNNIQGVKFSHNSISPPLEYDSTFFDAVYGLSIFTHLSEENHRLWIDELRRITKPGAVLILTTHGNAYREKLLPAEQKIFDSEHLVVQADTLEGHRTYAAYQPESWFRKLLDGKFEILQLIEGKKEHWGYGQDKWIVKRI